MIINPIIPVVFMLLICVALTLLNLKKVKNKKILLIRILMIVILFLINLRIMIDEKFIDGSKEASNLDVIFIVDNTISMQANDEENDMTRLDFAKSMIENITNELKNSRFAVIKYDNVSRIYVPLTYDAKSVISYVDSILHLNLYAAKESSINYTYENLEYLLTNISENDKDAVVFYFTDGENTDDRQLKSFSDLSEHIYDGAIIGMGTSEGSKIPWDEYDGSTYYLQDSLTYSDLITKRDDETLKTVADDLGIYYATSDNSEIVYKLAKNIYNQSKKENIDNEISNYSDTYYYFTGILICLLFLNLVYYKHILD